MSILFITTAAVAAAATILAVMQPNVIHALLYAVVSLLATAVLMYVIGAPFAAALEVIVYAGAVIVLFVFGVMMLNLGRESIERERRRLSLRHWAGPALLSGVLLVQLVLATWSGGSGAMAGSLVSPEEVGAALFGAYLLGVELASLLLLSGLVGAWHLGRQWTQTPPGGGKAGS